jgi:hypothetical protein
MRCGCDCDFVVLAVFDVCNMRGYGVYCGFDIIVILSPLSCYVLLYFCNFCCFGLLFEPILYENRDDEIRFRILGHVTSPPQSSRRYTAKASR